MRSHSPVTWAMLRRRPSWTVTRKFGPTEEIRLVRVEQVLVALEIDAVQDQVEVMPVRLDLRVGLTAQRRFDRQFVELEHGQEQRAFLVGGLRKIRPDGDATARVQPRRIDAGDFGRDSVAVPKKRVTWPPAASGWRSGP